MLIFSDKASKLSSIYAPANEIKSIFQEKGARIVKQWDATLDARTRSSHARVDGELRENDEKFSNGLLYPGDPSGSAAEVINCRCALLQRAKWALDDDELNTLKDRASYYGLDKTDSFNDFKVKYLDATKDVAYNIAASGPMTSSTDPYYNELLQTADSYKLEYNPVSNFSIQPTEGEIVDALSGGDLTEGSCASLSLAYIGQKQGWNVTDYRGDNSRAFFAGSRRLSKLSHAEGIVSLSGKGADTISFGYSLLKQCQNGKEYLLCAGKHASIVRRTDQGVLQYLELQEEDSSGWKNFSRRTLKERFGCSTVRKDRFGRSPAKFDFMVDIEASDFSTDEFKTLLGYLNTEGTKQMKGAGGFAK